MRVFPDKASGRKARVFVFPLLLSLFAPSFLLTQTTLAQSPVTSGTASPDEIFRLEKVPVG
jgi:hypothetical protein